MTTTVDACRPNPVDDHGIDSRTEAFPRDLDGEAERY
jgi:hypothetical protein